MKTNIILSALVALFTVGNINTVQGQERIYKNVYYDTETRSTVIGLYSGKNDANLVPVKKYIIYYSEDNLPREKVVFKWDKKKKKWNESRKYDYQYTVDGQASGVTHATWIDDDQAWSDERDYSLDLLEIDNQLLTIME